MSHYKRNRSLLAAVLVGALLLPVASRAEGPVKEPVKDPPVAISKSGIAYLADDDHLEPPELVKAIRARRAGGKLLNLDRMLLHSPAFTEGWNAMFGAIRGKLALPGKLRELAIMAIGTLNRAEYEWVQHEGEFLKAGGSKEQLAALRNVDLAAADEKRFDETERAVLTLTIEMTRNVQVAPATLQRVRSKLPDQQAIELFGTISGYNMVSRFVVVTGLE